MLSLLELVNFRSYKQLSLHFPNRTTVLIGPNGCGKTNLIESIYFSSLLHSFRARDDQLIQYGKDFFVIERTDADETIRLAFQTQYTPHKQIKLNDVKKLPKNMIGYLPVVLFEPSETELFNSSGERRRKLFDRILLQVDRDYVNCSIRYRRLIQMRNRLLKQARANQISRASLFDQLFVYDVQIVEVAEKIATARQKLIEFINDSLVSSYSTIADRSIELSIVYQKSNFATSEAQKHADIRRGFSSTGPHRDDFVVNHKTLSFTDSASRGEIRTLLLALKLAEYNFIIHQTKKTPTLLLDDVFSELDEKRSKNLLKIFGEAQIIITTTEKIGVLGKNLEYIEVKNLTK